MCELHRGFDFTHLMLLFHIWLFTLETPDGASGGSGKEKGQPVVNAAISYASMSDRLDLDYATAQHAVNVHFLLVCQLHKPLYICRHILWRRWSRRFFKPQQQRSQEYQQHEKRGWLAQNSPPVTGPTNRPATSDDACYSSGSGTCFEVTTAAAEARANTESDANFLLTSLEQNIQRQWTMTRYWQWTTPMIADDNDHSTLKVVLFTMHCLCHFYLN